MSEATPRPWQLGIAGNANVVHFDGDDVRPVALTWSTPNASLIVRAVNCHDELVEALKDALQIINENVDLNGKGLGRRLRKCDDAVAKAEGRK